MHTRPHRRPRTQVPKSRVCKLRTAYLGAALCKRAQRQPNANSKLLDGCSTDPEPDMEKRQAFFRNMRSKCRCSCVLQFTRHHGVSSVLHRPPSQMIHCIVLYFDSQTERSSDSVESSKKRLHIPTRGRSRNPVEARALQTVRTRLPCQWTNGLQYLTQRAIKAKATDKLSVSLHRMCQV